MLRFAVAAAAGVTALPAPTAAQEQNAYEVGVAARQAGDAAEAKRLLSTWLTAHPDDVDARLQLAYADLALGDLDAAQAGFEAVLQQAPGYRDATDGLAAVAERRNAASDATHGFVLVEGALSDLTGGARGWSEVAGEFEGPVSERTTLGGRLAYYRRFGLDDVEMTGRVAVHPSDTLWLRGSIGWTPNADYRPEVAIGGGLDVKLAPDSGTALTLDGAWQRFPLQTVVSINPGVVQYLGNGEAWITLRGIGTIANGGPLEVGALVRGDHVPADGWRVFGGVSNGPDTDLGVVTRVTGLFGGVEVPLGRKFGAVGSVAREWRKGGFDRTEFRLGLKAKF